MSTSDQSTSNNSEQSTTPEPQTDQIVDPRDLVYRGGSDRNPRELIENPAVTPEMVEQAPEDIRDDLMPKQKNDQG